MLTILAFVFLGSLLFGQLTSLILPFPLYAHDLALATLLTAGALILVVRKRWVYPQLLVAITAFTLVAAVSLLLNSRSSGGELWGLLYLLRWIFYALLYVFVVQKLVSAKFWLNGLFLVGTGFSLLGFAQFILYPSLGNLTYLGWDPYFYRLVSTLFDPNFVGLIAGLTIFLGFYFFKEKVWPVWLLVAAEILNLLALLLTFSRGSYLSFAAGLALYGFLTKNWKLLLGFMAALIIFIAIPKPPWEAFRLTRSISTQARVNNWITSFQRFTKAPLLGYGFKSREAGVVPSHAGAGIDSSLLFLLNTTGLLGLAVFSFLTLRIWLLGVKLRQFKKTQPLGTVFLTSLVALAVHSLFTNSVFYPWVMIWMWILVGVAEKSQEPNFKHQTK